MTKTDLKDAAGISASSIEKLGKGSNINTDILLRICEALHCHIEDIIEKLKTEGVAIMATLGKLTEIKDLRTAWPHEAIDFTPWLSKDENISLLSDAVGLDITVDEMESSVGDFNVDIFATETGTERRIIIENQLEDTNHDHLGKLITYASGKAAEVIIWVVKHAREEHRAAIEWLNNHTDEKIAFFLCEIKLYRIGNSEPAVKFDVIEKPNDWTKEVRKNESSTETQQQRYDYWVAFQEYAFKNAAFSKAFRRRRPSMDHWMNFSIGVSGCHIAVSQIKKRNELDVELYISEDKELFHALEEHKESIEAETGLSFDWRELPERKASRIVIEKRVSFCQKDQWPTQFDWLIDVMVKMRNAFKKYL